MAKRGRPVINDQETLFCVHQLVNLRMRTGMTKTRVFGVLSEASQQLPNGRVLMLSPSGWRKLYTRACKEPDELLFNAMIFTDDIPF